MPLDFVGKSRPLSDAGVNAAAQMLGVETSGCGYLADRRPQILFERHIFHRLTAGKFDDGDISDPTPGGYGPSGAHQYDRLEKALAFDADAAIQSASWGLGQIMGENCALAGFTDATAMADAMADSEDAQLQAMACFIVKSKIAKSLQDHVWAAFAAKYNGPSYAVNKYDQKLEAQYLKFSTGPTPDLDVRAAQLYLTFGNFNPGVVDGCMGSKTRAAVMAFQTMNGLAATGAIDATLLQMMQQVILGDDTASSGMRPKS
jgi:N-acetylmuramidase/Putative peptidoglycan binding domain